VADAAPRARRPEAFHAAGVKRYQLGEYAEALREFREAYRLKPDPSYLFNIGQCQRKLGQRDEAIGTFRSYLGYLPATSERRSDIEKLVAELERELERERERERAANLSVVAPPASPPPVIERPTSAPLAVQRASTPPAAEPPAWRRPWVLGAAGVVLAGAVVGSLLLLGDRSPEPLRCGDCAETFAVETK